MESDHEEQEIFYCEESPLLINPFNEMNEPWYTEFTRNFVRRQTRYSYWNDALRVSKLDFYYNPHSTLFTLNVQTTDQRAIPMIESYLLNLPELLMDRPTPSQQAALDTNYTFYSAILTGKYISFTPRGFEMYMKVRFRPATKSFFIHT